MALVGDIQLQDSAVKPPALDTSKRFSAEGLTATTAFAVTDAGAGTTVTPLGLVTAQSSNDISAYFNTTNTDGDINLYLNNDANPYWNLKLSGTASDSFMITNACGGPAGGTAAEKTALSITPVGAVGIGKTSASNALDISYQNSSSGGVVITEATNSVATKIISLATCSVMGTSTNHKLGFITNNTTVGMFDTSGNLGIGTESPGATLDVRGGAIFNEAGAAVDFRIEGDTEANLFIVDGSTDRIGIGTATPAVTVDVDTGGDGSDLLVCINGCICAAGYIGEAAGHVIEDAGVAETQRLGLNFVLTNVGCVVDDSSNDATVVCINGANTCVPFLMCDGTTSDPIALTGGSIGNQVANDSSPCLGGTLNGCDNNVCCVCCLAIKGCYFGDGSQLTGVSSVPSSFSGDCTIIGCNAGGNVAAGGAKIVLIGANAGYNATTPSNIVVMGSSAALCMTTATDTVLIGTGSGRCVLTCAGNLALGAWSLYNECAGSFNTALGTCAGLTQKGATTNTFVGAYAGTAVTTGSGNVFVGYKAGCASTASCCLIIGNGTCDLITGVFNTGIVNLGACVGIGTTVPDSILHLETAAVATAKLQIESTATDSYPNIRFKNDATTWDIYAPHGGQSDSFKVYEGTTGCAFSFTTDGKLGINTTAPGEPLSVFSSGNAYISSCSTGSSAGVKIASDSGSFTWYAANGTNALMLYDNTGGAERIRIDSSGNVGIGNNDPADYTDASGALLVVGCAATVSGISIISTTAGRLNFGDGDGDPGQWAGHIQYSHSANTMGFAVAEQAVSMTLSSTGLGIGTASPNTVLEVTGDTSISNGYGLVVGHTSLLSFANSSEVQILGTGGGDSRAAFGAFIDSTVGPGIEFLKSRNGTIGSNTIVQDGDDLGDIVAYVDDGTDFGSRAGYIRFQVDGTPGANDTPGRIIFGTTADGSAGETERLRISSAGLVSITGSAEIDSVPVVSSEGPYGSGANGAVSNIIDQDENATTIAQTGTISLTSNRILRATSTITLSQAITVSPVIGQARGTFSDLYGGPGIELGAIFAALASKGIPIPLQPAGQGASDAMTGGIVQLIATGNVVVGGTITADAPAAGSSDGGGGGGLVVIISSGTISGSSAISVAGVAGHATAAAKAGAGAYSGEPGGHAGIGGSGGGMGGSYWTYGGVGNCGGGSTGGTGIICGNDGGAGAGNPNRTGGGGGSLDGEGHNGGNGAPGNRLLAQYGSFSPPITRCFVAASGAGGYTAQDNGGGGGGGGYAGGQGGTATACSGSGGGGGAEGATAGSVPSGSGGNGGTGGLMYSYSSDSVYAGMPGGMGGGGGGGVGYFGTASGGPGTGTKGDGAAGGAGASPIVASQGNGAGGAGGAGDDGGAVESTYYGAMGGDGGTGGNGGGAAGLVLMVAPTITYSGTVTGRHIKITGTDAEEFIKGLLTYG